MAFTTRTRSYGDQCVERAGFTSASAAAPFAASSPFPSSPESKVAPAPSPPPDDGAPNPAATAIISATSPVVNTQSTSLTFSPKSSIAKSSRDASSFLSKHGITVAWNTADAGTPSSAAIFLFTMQPITCCGDFTALTWFNTAPPWVFSA
eukprot:31430-Pelagococcus_subviridis.AAC.8